MVIEIKTAQEFKDKIFDYDVEDDWKFKGDKPAIVDFSALWCQPCKIVGPILEELSEKYDGKIDIYKIDVDNLPDVSQSFGIKSIPSILFIPMEGEPQMSIGGLPKSTFETAIKNVLKIKN